MLTETLPETEQTTLVESNEWSSAEKIAFRFCFLLLGLFIIIQNNGAFPLWELVNEQIVKGLQVVIPWLGKNVYGIPYDITIFTNGSGDTTYDYVIVLSIAIISLAGTVVWSLLDRQRPNYDRLYYWLSVGVRFYVGLMLINYGLVKVFKLQFPDPGLSRLSQPYGESSPMGLAWTFLGFSKGYNYFMGFAELAASLLFFRRTVTLGALITMGTTMHIMAVNYFYDVPVKILSTALFLMSVFLLSRNAGRLFRFFLVGESTRLVVVAAPVFRKRWLRIGKVALKGVVIAYALGFGTYQTMEYMNQYGPDAPKTKLYGMYHVKDFVLKSDTMPPLQSDSSRWKSMYIEYPTFARVKFMNDSLVGFSMQLDTAKRSVVLTKFRDGTVVCFLNYTEPDEKTLLLTGKVINDSVAIRFDKVIDVDKRYRLTNRGFHWVNEYPYNR